MLFSSIYERYIPSQDLPAGDIAHSVVFAADADKLLVKKGAAEDEVVFPDLNDFGSDLLGNEDVEYLGAIDGFHCFFLPWEPSASIPDGMIFQSLRTMYDRIGENMGLVASRAVHLAGWSRQNRYCGVCGGLTLKDNDERARRCPSCGNVIYPRISPAIIIAVVKDDKLLLAHNKGFRERWFSTIAGFMEPGESIEACAKREVYEETGIKIKNIRYFASQPWPFPDSLMIGLTAEYESGEVATDGVEIDEAGFFSVAGLPERPGNHSIAGRLIQWFIDGQKDPGEGN